MLNLILGRLAWSLPLLFIVTLIVFSMLQLAPGDPARIIAGEDAEDSQVERQRAGDPTFRPEGR